MALPAIQWGPGYLSQRQELRVCKQVVDKMSTLEDKILGEKREYYCSSSSSESEGNNESEDEMEPSKNAFVDRGPPPLNPSDGGSTNTGPKGVIKDWQQFKQIEAERRVEREKERLALIKKLSLTCRSELDKEKEEDPELSELLDDPFLLEYSKKKVEEMLWKSERLPTFGSIQTITNGQEFLDAIDKENKKVTVVIHIYEEKVPECRVMNYCLNELCKDYPEVKFCKLLAANAGVSRHFKVSGVPALLIYKNGTLIGNFVKVSGELGNEFAPNDLENFLIENGILFDKSLVTASGIRQSKLEDELD